VPPLVPRRSAEHCHGALQGGQFEGEEPCSLIVKARQHRPRTGGRVPRYSPPRVASPPSRPGAALVGCHRRRSPLVGE
jgi:hypothetical protein